MRVTAVETFVLSNRCVLVKVSSDEGLAGWGEATLEGWALPVAATVRRMSRLLVGANPLHTTALWQRLARAGFYRGGAVLSSGLAGVDQALWDLRGRFYGAPVHDLLGGPCRDRVRMYTHANGARQYGDVTPNRTGDSERARRLADAGYTMLKVTPAGPVPHFDAPAGARALAADLAELRAAVGDGVDLAVDLHGRYSLAQSRRVLPLLEPMLPVFVEEPVRPEYSGRLEQITASTSVPIATGERLYSREEFRPVLEAGVAVAQPDVSHAGGITECFRIAALAESYDVALAPHCPLGPVALAASLQLDLAVPNFLAQEHVIDLSGTGSPDLAILHTPEVLLVRGGYLDRPTGPGLGIEIDEDAVRRSVVGEPADETPGPWTQADGGFAEW